jgi:UDPglucose 6-dehydrogenase
MQVAVIGAGHVGLVTAACLARVGHDVVANDDDQAKLERLRAGRPWFHEPGLPELLAETIDAGRLRFTADKGEAVRHGEVIFICVGTPSRADGSPNLQYLEAVAREVAQALPAGSFRLVCEKSTVPVQTGDRVAQVLAREGPPQAAYEVTSNPEFLREGSAVHDTLNPDRIVVGTDTERGAALLAELYRPIVEATGCELLATDRATAELIKHASNAFLATKISFPKDVAAFTHRSAELGVDFGILRETARVNLAARQRVLDKVRDALWHLAGKRVGVLGLAFKAETDDLREAPAMDVVRGLLAEGAEVVAYDPVAGDQAVDLLPEMKLAPEPLDAVEGAHALVVMTGWPELVELDPVVARERMAYPILVDARNALDAEAFGRAGFTVIGVGRPVRNALTPAWR